MLIDLSATELAPRRDACAEHGDYLSACQVIRIGRLRREIWSTCPQCKTRAATQAHLDQAEQGAAAQQDRLAGLLQQSAIPRRFAGCNFDDYKADSPEQARVLAICRRYAEGFERHLARGTGLVLAGKMGTGKTHLASAILREILPAHVGAYTTMMDLVHTLRAGWGIPTGIPRGIPAHSEAQVLAELGRLPLLVIDEIGVQFGSAAEQVHLFEVLDRRYRDMRPTILLTNQDRDGFAGFVGDRISDRLSETASWVECNWPSYRLTARKENTTQLEKS